MNKLKVKNEMMMLYKELFVTGKKCLVVKAELLLPVAMYGRYLTKNARKNLVVLMETLLAMNLNEKSKRLASEIREALYI